MLRLSTNREWNDSVFVDYVAFIVEEPFRIESSWIVPDIRIIVECIETRHNLYMKNNNRITLHGMISEY